MTDENQNLLGELRAKLVMQHAILKVLVHVINDRIPDAKLIEQIDSLYSETFMHFIPDMPPELADSLENYYRSFVQRD